jgi:hypothetical protein
VVFTRKRRKVSGTATASRAATVLEIVDDYAIGHALRAVNRAGPVPPLPELDPIEFPHLAARVAQEVFEQPYEDTFEIGLDAVLDGIERRFAS